MKYPVIVLFILILATSLWAQHRGDNLAFQGLGDQNEAGVAALGIGGAYTSFSGDLNALFYNPAGLADISTLQISVSMNSTSKLWRENQNYRPNRIYWTLPFYLEGLYTPDPANNGVWDYELAQDSSYIVRYPELGLEPFSEEAADWQRKINVLGLNNISIAYPLDMGGNKIVLAGGFYRRYNLYDFDRNDTYLDPHIGFDGYGVVQRVVTDTVRFNWDRFLRQRDGRINSINGAVAYNINDNLKVGIGFSTFSGETEDYQYLNRVGFFEIAKDNRFRFSYDTLDVSFRGKSSFTSTSFNFGALYKLDRIGLGVNAVLPYTITRDWKYTKTTLDTNGISSQQLSGKDEFEVPATISFGIHIKPADKFTVAFDYQFSNYSKAVFKLSHPDSLHQSWADQQIIRFGIEYRPFEMLALRAGYRNIPAVFIPDGAADKEKGPVAESFVLGFGLKLFDYGRLDAAFELRQLKYYDSYFSNTNYQYEQIQNLNVAYTYAF